VQHWAGWTFLWTNHSITRRPSCLSYPPTPPAGSPWAFRLLVWKTDAYGRSTLFKAKRAVMKQHSNNGAMRLLNVLEIAVVLFAQNSVTNPADPNHSEVTTNTLNSTNLLAQPNILVSRDQVHPDHVARQVACPNPSTNQFCQSGSCFLSQSNGASAWGTCCPAGWYLILNSAHWASQKCCPSGNCAAGSQPPSRPVNCGSGGTISGWACVYGNEAGRAALSKLMVFTTVVAWVVCWSLW